MISARSTEPLLVILPGTSGGVGSLPSPALPPITADSLRIGDGGASGPNRGSCPFTLEIKKKNGRPLADTGAPPPPLDHCRVPCGFAASLFFGTCPRRLQVPAKVRPAAGAYPCNSSKSGYSPVQAGRGFSVNLR